MRLHLQAFEKLFELGYELTLSSIWYHTDESPSDRFLIQIQSDTRQLQVSHHSWLRMLESKPEGHAIEATFISVQALDQKWDRHLNINGYLSVIEAENFQEKFSLYNLNNPLGISIDNYYNRLSNLGTYIFTHFKAVIEGKDWVSASQTRLDGFKIIRNGKSVYYN